MQRPIKASRRRYARCPSLAAPYVVSQTARRPRRHHADPRRRSRRSRSARSDPPARTVRAFAWNGGGRRRDGRRRMAARGQPQPRDRPTPRGCSPPSATTLSWPRLRMRKVANAIVPIYARSAVEAIVRGGAPDHAPSWLVSPPSTHTLGRTWRKLSDELREPASQWRLPVD